MFKTVAELGSITRAAEVLHCVPSNITRGSSRWRRSWVSRCFCARVAGCASVRLSGLRLENPGVDRGG